MSAKPRQRAHQSLDQGPGRAELVKPVVADLKLHAEVVGVRPAFAKSGRQPIGRALVGWLRRTLQAVGALSCVEARWQRPSAGG